jgi:hypothetical protein
MTQAGTSKSGRGASVEGKLVNQAEPQTGSGTGATKSVWGCGKHTELKNKEAGLLMSTQSHNSPYFLRWQHTTLTPDWGLGEPPDTVEGKKLSG